MEDSSAGLLWQTPAMAQASWEEMLNDLLQDPVTADVPASEGDCPVDICDDFLLGLLEGGLEDCQQVVGSGERSGSGEPLVGNSGTGSLLVDAGVIEGELRDLGNLDNSFPVEEYVDLPGLSSELSSLADDRSPVMDDWKDRAETLEISQQQGISSPGSYSWVEAGGGPSSNSDEEVGNASRANSPILTSGSGVNAASPDTGGDSSDVGARGKSCDNFAGQSEKYVNSSPGVDDEEAKRQGRLERNRESASQSRLRKKSYVKELEAKCRAMETQLSMLHQTVAFTSAQNTALREELAHVKCQNGNGSKSGATEPAALPSDSLPSESPSHLTFQCLSVKWELVAFLCHVLLLTLLQALPLKQATSGESTPSKARSQRRSVCVESCASHRSHKVKGRAKNHRSSSGRRRKRNRKGNVPLMSLISTFKHCYT